MIDQFLFSFAAFALKVVYGSMILMLVAFVLFLAAAAALTARAAVG